MSAQNAAEEARQKGRALVQRMIDDPALKQRVREDPAGTLTTMGLPEQAVGDFVRELNLPADEVAGFMLPRCSCDEITCIISVCSCSLCGTTD